MSGRVFFMTGFFGIARVALAGCKILPVLMLASPIAGYSQSYLDAIQVEAEKLDDGTATNSDEVVSPSPAPDADGSLARFEKELEDSYRGSYLFYKKLPKKSQEEVYLEYQGGDSIEEVRNTIMDRFIHSR